MRRPPTQTTGRRAGQARRAPAALRPPRGALRRQWLEPAGRAAGRRAHRRDDVRRVVLRPPGARHRQRQGPAAEQRRHGRDACDATRGGCGCCSPTWSGGCSRPPGCPTCRPMHAMTVHKSQGSQAEDGQRDHASRGLPAADPRAVLHGRDAGPGTRARSSAPRRPSAPLSAARCSARAACASGSAAATSTALSALLQLGLRLADLRELLLGRARDEVVPAVEPEVRQCRGEDGRGDPGRLDVDEERRDDRDHAEHQADARW